MKEKEYVDLICQRFCVYYKGGREEIRCGTFSFLRSTLSSGELRELIEAAGASGEAPTVTCAKDQDVMRLACEGCDFRIDGCDFRDGRVGPPCGGYAVMERILG